MEGEGEGEGAKSNDVSAAVIAEPLTDIASNIKYHAQYTPHFSPFKFEPLQAYYAATADSVRDRLIKVSFVL